MSGTPSISELYTVVGNRVPGARLTPGISLVVLARGPWMFRPTVLAQACALGFDEVLCVEVGPPRYDVSTLLKGFPGLRFLVFPSAVTPGERINAAAREVAGDRFLVLWDDQKLPDLPPKALVLWGQTSRLALVPELRDAQGAGLPSVLVPSLAQDRLKILALGADEDTVDTLFPRDYTALYHRRRFLATGGYDASLTNPFWQKADWGLRSRLWGEALTVEKGFRVDYRSAVPTDDQTPDRSYLRFYLRNLGVRHVGDHGVLPLSRLWAYARRSGLTLSQAVVTFRAERAWVHTHRYRFQTDVRLLSELWGSR